MRILLAGEESQAVCIEFRKLGHEAFSCDILECSGGHPEWHIQGDVIEQLDKGWDMMIGFPPCTHLACSGAAWFEQKRKDGRQQEGIDFFMKLINAPIERIAIENPIGIMSRIYHKPDQIIQPYYFGDPVKKSTCLWLKNLPLLHHSPSRDLFSQSSNYVPPVLQQYKSSKTKSGFSNYSGGATKWYRTKEERSRERSKTFPGIAKAIAEQWGKL